MIEVMDFIHSHGYFHRALNYNNFIVRRREAEGQGTGNYLIEVCLSELGRMEEKKGFFIAFGGDAETEFCFQEPIMSNNNSDVYNNTNNNPA
jgi:hypothetical protein